MSDGEPVLDRPRPSWLLGPWPLAPLATFVMLFAASVVVTFRTELFTPTVPCILGCWTVPQAMLPGFLAGAPLARTIDPVVVVGYSAALTVASALTLMAFQRVLGVDDLHAPTRRGYLTAITTATAVGSVAGLAALAVMGRTVIAENFLATAVRVGLVLVLIHWVSGRLTYGYAMESARANAALVALTAQRGLIVQADERARREIADFLHDRVQAELLVAGMRLRALTSDVDPASRAELDEVVGELERIRQVGVRGAGQRLSPDTASLGLYLTTTYLASTWSPAMTVTVDFSAEAQHRLVAPLVPAQVPTALYRVIEQTLLNSAAHGHASRVTVRVWLADDTVRLDVTDDGRGLAQAAASDVPDDDGLHGSGTALCDAWMDAVGGTWSREQTPAGVRVTATVPLTPSAES